MRGFFCTRSNRAFAPAVSVVVALLVALPLSVPAEAADARLESAQQRRAAVQERLQGVLTRLDSLQAQTAEVEDRVAELRAVADRNEAVARGARSVLQARIVDAYKRGQVPVALTLFSTDGMDEATERARLLSVLAVRDRATSESALSAQIRAQASAAELGKAVAELEVRESQLDAARRDVQVALDAARADEASVAQQIAAEEAAAERAARERVAREERPDPAPAAAAAGGATAGGGGGAAAVSGGVACPVGSPRNYSDTWGAPRSGGRSHLGTDILAPTGTPSYAYESGTIVRMNSSSLGGISLYLRGKSGTIYFYTHLSGYAAGASAGKTVSAGELIAYVGDTGNAAGIPHLHFEVMPGGGGNVNPYPYVLRACG